MRPTNNDPDTYGITYAELAACGKAQGIDIRPAAQGGDIKIGDILFIRSGWTKGFLAKTPEERASLALRQHGGGQEEKQRYAGVAQEEAMLDWLHDSYFAAVAGDAPSFESWPTRESYYLHEFILALWGMPLGEMLDLERLAEKCKEKGRWIFFFGSSPANVPGEFLLFHPFFNTLNADAVKFRRCELARQWASYSVRWLMKIVLVRMKAYFCNRNR